MSKTSTAKPVLVSDNTERKQSNLVPFKPGQSGNPNGRPAGSRNKLGEAFVADLLADWEKHGADAIRRMCETDPSGYVRVIASIMLKHIALARDPIDDLIDDDVTAFIAMLREAQTDG